MNDITKFSASTITHLIKKKELTSEQVTKAFLKRIAEVNPKINAIVDLNEDSALEQAYKSDQKIKNGEILGLLEGLPITIKDSIDIIGYRNTYGSHLYDEYSPKVDGTCVTRLREAGAVILGLTNVPELLGALDSDNLIYGRTNNPHDLNRSPGGSSGGESAIIAACGSPFGLGSDGGGSIRVPAHYCGIAGIKPSQGFIPITGLKLPFAGPGGLQGFGTFGPMARSIDDLTLGMKVLSGADGIDPNCYPISFGDPNKVDVKNLRVAYYIDNGIATPSKEIASAVLDTVGIFSDLGAKVTEAKPKGLEYSFDLLWAPFFTLCDGAKTVVEQLSVLSDNKISPLRKQFLSDSKKYDFNTYELNKIYAEIAKLKFSVFNFFKNYDIIICPPCATTAKLHNQSLTEIKDFSYTMTYNLTGSPAVVVPFSMSSEGLPIGVQIAANLWQDHIALAAAKYIEDQVQQKGK